MRWWSITGSWRSWSTLNVIMCRSFPVSTTLDPDLPCNANGIDSNVFRALPCAPRVGLTYTSRELTRYE
jgi:hypothetical protein